MVLFAPLLLSETFLVLPRIKRDIIVKLHGISGTVPVILVRF